MAELLDQIRVLIEQVVTHLGYPGIALVMFIENIFTPIPSEVVMPFAGFRVAAGQYSFWSILIAGTFGSVLGALVIYYIGVWADERVIRACVRRYGRFLFVSEDDLDRSLRVFDRYGDSIILFGRLVPMVRSLVSLPAGMNRMPLGRFLFFTTLGTSLWTGLLAYVGMALGENWESLLGYVKQYEQVTLITLAALATGFVIVRVWQYLGRLVTWSRFTED